MPRRQLPWLLPRPVGEDPDHPIHKRAGLGRLMLNGGPDHADPRLSADRPVPQYRHEPAVGQFARHQPVGRHDDARARERRLESGLGIVRFQPPRDPDRAVLALAMPRRQGRA
jgi:hypothetical protein